MLKYRIITSVFMISVIIVSLFLLPLIYFALVTEIICILSAWEWSKLVKINVYSYRILFVVLCSVLMLIIMLSVPGYKIFINNWRLPNILLIALIWWITALFLVFLYPRSAKLWRKYYLLQLTFGILTIVPFFYSIIILRQYNYTVNQFTGSWWLLYVMILVWGMDSGAYIFGQYFGNYKLLSKVSPGKTLEGLAGGVISSAVVTWLFNKYVNVNITPLILLIISFFTGLAAILGDLTESMFKREAGVKDSGDLILGHGGILDRIDSLTAAIPVFTYLILLLFERII